jgi:hypothetical protein
MDFLKKHYEKIILSLALLGLVAGALVFLLIVIPGDQDEIKKMTSDISHPRAVALTPLDLSDQNNLLERMKSSYNLDFSTTNRLFNSMQWQKGANGIPIKVKTGKEIGAGAVAVTRLTPLYFSISFDTVETNGVSPRYSITVEDQSAAIPSQRRKRSHFASPDETISERTVTDKNEGFKLVSIIGAPENPDGLVLKLADTGETNTIAKGRPFQRVDGYAADLQYEPEAKKWAAQRQGADLKFANDDYIIVAIHSNEVILSAASNQKKTVLQYPP